MTNLCVLWIESGNGENVTPEYSKVKVYSLLALGLLSFGFAPIIVKFVTNHSALLITTIRTASAFLFLIPVYFYQRKSKKYSVAAVSKDSLWVFLAGFCLGLHFLLWIGSLYFTSVASASILVTIHPIMLVIAERTMYKVKFPPTVWIGVLIAFAGSALLGYSDSNIDSEMANPLLGNAMAFSAAVIFVIYFLIGRRVRQNRSWLGYVFPVYGYAALTSLIILFIVEGIPGEIPFAVLLAGLGLAVGPQLMGHGAFNYAIKYISPTLLSTLILGEPIFATILAFFFFGEWPVAFSFVAIIIIMVGVALSWMKKINHRVPQNK
ncbi:MAG: DMT family transporter [Balneolaceae bacterium]